MGETNNVESSPFQRTLFKQHKEIMHKPCIISAFSEDRGRKTSLSSTVAFGRAQSETEGGRWKGRSAGCRNSRAKSDEHATLRFASPLSLPFHFRILLAVALSPHLFCVTFSSPFKIFSSPFLWFIFILFFSEKHSLSQENSWEKWKWMV